MLILSSYPLRRSVSGEALRGEPPGGGRRPAKSFPGRVAAAHEEPDTFLPSPFSNGSLPAVGPLYASAGARRCWVQLQVRSCSRGPPTHLGDGPPTHLGDGSPALLGIEN